MGTMNKKIITALMALTLVLPTTANAAVKNNISNKAAQAPTIAILDTAIDMSQQKIKDRVIYEVCILEFPVCPNGTSKMEGPGAATMDPAKLMLSGFDHGTQMTSVAIQTNPNVNIVFIRIIANRADGSREYTSEASVYNALQWVIENQAKFNIQAVSMSQGHHVLGAAGTDYCPKTLMTQSKIQTLNSLGLGVFFPAGNARDYVRIDWPACIPESIAMGATMPTNEVAIYTNHDSALTDFFALGTLSSTGVNGAKVNIAGTSASVQAGAVAWATVKSAKPNLSYDQIYALLAKTSISTKNSKITGGKLINLQGALNG
jgi:hypothetical protein